MEASSLSVSLCSIATLPADRTCSLHSLQHASLMAEGRGEHASPWCGPWQELAAACIGAAQTAQSGGVSTPRMPAAGDLGCTAAVLVFQGNACHERGVAPPAQQAAVDACMCGPGQGGRLQQTLLAKHVRAAALTCSLHAVRRTVGTVEASLACMSATNCSAKAFKLVRSRRRRCGHLGCT